LGIGIVLQVVGFLLVQFADPDSAFFGAPLIVISIPVFIWGCTNYAEGKGHSKWVGLVGLGGVIGLMVLMILPDQECDESVHRLPIHRLVGLITVVGGLGLAAFGRRLDDLEYVSGDIAGLLMLSGTCLAVGSLALLLGGQGSSPASPPESAERREKRLKAKARELLVLEFCHQVLSERIKTDADQAHLWQLEDKVATGLLQYLRHTLPAEFRNPEPALSASETEEILEKHPLLHLSSVEMSDGMNVRKHIRQMRAKLLKYVDYLDAKSREEAKK
jgi:hypothetical protein